MDRATTGALPKTPVTTGSQASAVSGHPSPEQVVSIETPEKMMNDLEDALNARHEEQLKTISSTVDELQKSFWEMEKSKNEEQSQTQSYLDEARIDI